MPNSLFARFGLAASFFVVTAAVAVSFTMPSALADSGVAEQRQLLIGAPLPVAASGADAQAAGGGTGRGGEAPVSAADPLHAVHGAARAVRGPRPRQGGRAGPLLDRAAH